MDLDELCNDEITVIRYEHIDDPECFSKPDELLHPKSLTPELLEKVKSVFKKAGWKGDGEIGIIWIPSFFCKCSPDTCSEQNYGTYIWHVKQHNNGHSFLGFYPDGLNYVANNSQLALKNEGLFDEDEIIKLNGASI